MGDKKKSAARRATAKKRAASNKKRATNRFKEGGKAIDKARNEASKNKPKVKFDPIKRAAAIKAKKAAGYYKKRGQVAPKK